MPRISETTIITIKTKTKTKTTEMRKNEEKRKRKKKKEKRKKKMRERNTNRGEVATVANCLMMVRVAIKMEAQNKKNKKINKHR